MLTKDPTTAKSLLPVLEKRGDIAMSDDLDSTLANFDSHLMTQMFKVVATHKATNAGKRAKGKSGATEDN